MCGPVAIMVALTAASTAMNVYGQNQTAEAQADSIEDQARLQNEALEKQYEQMRQQGTDKVSEVAKQAMIEQARMRVSAGESGIAGSSVDSIMGESMFNAAEAVSGIQKNVRNGKDQSELEGRGMYAANKSKANSIKQPDWIGAGLQIAGSVAGNWNGLKAEMGSGVQAPAPVVERSFN